MIRWPFWRTPAVSDEEFVASMRREIPKFDSARRWLLGMYVVLLVGIMAFWLVAFGILRNIANDPLGKGLPIGFAVGMAIGMCTGLAIHTCLRLMFALLRADWRAERLMIQCHDALVASAGERMANDGEGVDAAEDGTDPA